MSLMSPNGAFRANHFDPTMLVTTYVAPATNTITSPLLLADTGTITVNSTNVLTVTGPVNGLGALTKDGTGTLSLNAANTYTGTTSVNVGTLSLGHATALGTTPGVNGTSGISISAGSILQAVTPGTTPSTTIAAPITLLAGGNTTLSIGQGGTSTFNINGPIGGATTNLIFTTSTASFSNFLSLFVMGAASNYTGNILITTGNGGNNPVTLRAGTGIVNALPTTTVLSFGQVAGAGSGRVLTYDLNGNNQTLAGLDNGGVVPALRKMNVTSTAAATLTLNNTADFIFGGATTSSGFTQGAFISGAISLTKSGAGTFTLGGTLSGGAPAQGNTHTGTTTALGGILVLGESISIQSSAFDTTNSIAGDATNGLRVGIGGTGVTTLTLGGLTGANDFSTRFTTTSGGYNGLTAMTLNPSTGVTNSYSGNIGDGAGAMSLTKTGTGTQTLSGANTYTGTTSVSAGVLNIQNASGLGTTAAGTTVTSGAALQLQGGITVGAEALTLNGTGVSSTGALRNISGTNTYGGLLTLGAASRINSDSGTLTLSNVGTITGSGFNLTVGGAGNTTVSSIIGTGAGTLTKDGAGTVTLSGANTYTGTTTVSVGTLILTGSISTGAVSVAGGTFQGPTTTGASGTGTGAFTVTSNTSSVIRPGTFGNNTLNTGALTFSGASARATFDSTTTTFSSINVTGTVALGGMGCIFPAGITTNGVYDLIVASGTMSGTLPSIITNSTGKTLVLSISGNTLKVTVS